MFRTAVSKVAVVMEMALILGLSFSAVWLFSPQALSAKGSFPTSPDASMTPGSYCTSPTSRRYPEKIAYCERNVETSTKLAIFAQYNRNGYNIDMKDRMKYKIDHLIPLCAGGSNKSDNLWPQHESIYVHTDPIEAAVCSKMSQGRMKQKVAIEFVFAAKRNPMNAEQVLKKVLAY